MDNGHRTPPLPKHGRARSAPREGKKRGGYMAGFLRPCCSCPLAKGLATSAPSAPSAPHHPFTTPSAALHHLPLDSQLSTPPSPSRKSKIQNRNPRHFTNTPPPHPPLWPVSRPSHRTRPQVSPVAEPRLHKHADDALRPRHHPHETVSGRLSYMSNTAKTVKTVSDCRKSIQFPAARSRR